MNPRVISFHYTLTDSAGTLLDTSSGNSPLSFLEGVGQIIPGLEKVLVGLKPGDKAKVEVEAAEAYGVRDERYVMSVPYSQLPKEKIEIGDEFSVSEDEHGHPFRVTELNENYVTLDGNHPLAGVDLTFEVEITESREATSEELAHGHAHGGDGHHH